MSDSGGTSAQSYQGAETAQSATTDFNSLEFMMQRLINRISTATLVKVQAVSNKPGEKGNIGHVDVLPLVNQMDGYNNAVKHGKVYGLAYFRYQGGKHAVIIDPKVGDIGVAVFADRDISSVKANKDQANPGSRRRFDMADGIYIGLSVGGENPEQYIRFFEEDNKQGIQMHDKNGNDVLMNDQGTTITDKSGNKIVMTSSGINLNP